MEIGKAMGAWASAAEAALSMGTLVVLCFSHAKSSTVLALAWGEMLAEHQSRAFRRPSECSKVSATLARGCLWVRLQRVRVVCFLRRLTLILPPLPPLPPPPPHVPHLLSPNRKGIHQSAARHHHRLKRQRLLPLPRLRVGRQQMTRSTRISC